MSAIAGLHLRPVRERPFAVNRWAHLVVAALAMMALANMQFASSALARLPGRPPAAALLLQSGLAAFLFAQTLMVPLERWLVDRLGPLLPAAVGALASAVSWYGASRAEGKAGLLLWTLLGGAGAGVFYAGTVARALEKFADHRGLCVAVAAGAGLLGMVVTAWPIARALGLGYPLALVPWDLAETALMVVAALFVVDPLPPGWTPPG